MMRRAGWFLSAVAAMGLAGGAFAQTARVKDVATLKGVRDNQLYGYGLAVGLNGTGDSRNFMPAVAALSNMLTRMNVTVHPTLLKAKNVAAVVVTARLFPFKEEGSKIDVVVSSVGDAKSLAGGNLVQTPLQGPDGRVYAVAQGPVSIDGENPLSGRVVRGAIVETELPDDFVRGRTLTFVLEKADFSTAALLAQTINQEIQERIAFARNGSTVDVEVPEKYAEEVVMFISRLEQLPVVYPSSEALVVIDQKTWTVVINGRVEIMPVAISHGDITLTVPGPERLIEVNAEGTPLESVVEGLKLLKASPQDLAQIIMAIDRAGALKAKLEIVE